MCLLVLRVFDDADDLEVVLMAVAIAAEMLADWVLVLEKLLREPFIDNRDPRRCWRVLLADGAATQQTRPDGLEVIRPDPQPRSVVAMFAGEMRAPRHIDRRAPVVAL